jgi:hypothetical protein
MEKKMVNLRSPRFNKPMDAAVRNRKAQERQQMIQYLNRPKELLSVSKAKYQVLVGEDVDCTAEQYHNEVRNGLYVWSVECRDLKEAAYAVMAELAIEKLDKKFGANDEKNGTSK